MKWPLLILAGIGVYAAWAVLFTRMATYNLLVSISVPLLATVLFALLEWWFFTSDCPRCRRRRALRKTWRKKFDSRSGATRIQYQCKYCGHKTWEWHSPDQHGGDFWAGIPVDRSRYLWSLAGPTRPRGSLHGIDHGHSC